MVEDKKINKTVGLQLLEKVIKTQKDPSILANELGLLVTISDDQIKSLLIDLKNENPKVQDDYKNDPSRVEPFIIGYVMKNTKGKADSVKVKNMIKQIF